MSDGGQYAALACSHLGIHREALLQRETQAVSLGLIWVTHEAEDFCTPTGVWGMTIVIEMVRRACGFSEMV
jgi:hypothetical protein